MRTAFYVLTALILLAGCHAKPKPAAPQADDPGAAQVTSIDDADLPVDKSDQITSIDAATGDASGMPHEGGGVIDKAKPEAKKAEEAAATAPPLVIPPPVASSAPAMENPIPDAQ